MKLSEELEWRGFVNQTTLKDLTELDKRKRTFYHGFDASADSLTVGNLAALMLDKLLIRHGFTPILLAGGATSLIGDPGGKDAERTIQSHESIADNVTEIEKQIKLIIPDAKLVNNLLWYKDMNILNFLRDVGKHFSMTPLVQRDYIAKRMGEGGNGITYTEFSYTLLQGYDYLHLFEKTGVDLQVAGSDQWGNTLSGVELIRRVHGKEADALTMPLMVNHATGKKFGKSEDGAVWLDPKQTTPTSFYQFWMNLDDGGVSDYLKIFTEYDKEKIAQIMTDHEKNPGKRIAQTALATAVTELVHGKVQTLIAVDVTKLITGQADFSEIDSSSLDSLKVEIPTITVGVHESLQEILVKSGLAESNTEARRLILGGAVYVNNVAIHDENLDDNLFKNNMLLIRRGKAYKDSALILRG